MNKYWFHMVGLILVGYLIGYYWRGLGNMTIGKLTGAGA